MAQMRSQTFQKNDKKDNQLASVTDGEELSDAGLILVDMLIHQQQEPGHSASIKLT